MFGGALTLHNGTREYKRHRDTQTGWLSETTRESLCNGDAGNKEYRLAVHQPVIRNANLNFAIVQRGSRGSSADDRRFEPKTMALENGWTARE